MRFLIFILLSLFTLPAWAQDALPEFSFNDPMINKKGKMQIPSTYLKKISFDQNLAPVIIDDGNGEKRIGIINTSGKFLVEPRFVRAEKSSYGLIALKNTSGNWEFYNVNSGFVPQKENAQEYQIISAQYILIGSNHKWGMLVLHKKGNKYIDPIYKNIEYVAGNSFKFYHFNSWLLKDRSNTVINNFAFDSLSFSNDSILKYQINKGSGFINYQNKEAAPIARKIIYLDPNILQLDSSLLEFKLSKSTCLVKGKYKMGVVNSQGKIIIPCIYDSIRGPYENIFVVFSEGKMGIINHEGEVYSELNNRFEKVFPFKEGRAKVIKAGKFGFIDMRGNVRVAPQYLSVHDFKEGLAAVIINGKWGFVDKDENIVVQPHYNEVKDFSNGVARAKSNSKWYFVNKEGKKLTNAYDDIIETGIDKWELIRNKKKGLANRDGKELLAPRYEYMEDIDNSLVIVKKDNKWGVVDYNENFLFPIEFDFISYDYSTKLFLFMKKGKEEVVEINYDVLK